MCSPSLIRLSSMSLQRVSLWWVTSVEKCPSSICSSFFLYICRVAHSALSLTALVVDVGFGWGAERRITTSSPHFFLLFPFTSTISPVIFPSLFSFFSFFIRHDVAPERALYVQVCLCVYIHLTLNNLGTNTTVLHIYTEAHFLSGDTPFW